MKMNEFLTILEADYPLCLQESWDNSGLQAGRRDKEIRKVLLALDPTEEVVDQAIEWNADLILTHHPMTLSGMKKINTDDFITRKFFKVIRSDINCYAMHTNFDVARMADAAASRLGLKVKGVLEETASNPETGKPRGIGVYGSFENSMTLHECAMTVKHAFGLESVRIFGDPESRVASLAMCPGSGKSLIREALSTGSDVYLTGDIGHHDGLDAVAQGILIIDAGHYGLEHIFVEEMIQYFAERMPELEVNAARQEAPFQTLI